jgi:transcriptional regulator with XRE-family HTH domain
LALAGHGAGMILTGAQVREARELLGWSRIKLAVMTSLGAQRIMLVETDDWLVTPANIERVRAVMEAAGVTFEDGRVRLQEGK